MRTIDNVTRTPLLLMYNKLFTKILDSSIWLEPVTTRIVWITLLAAMDEDGYAHFSAIENLANRARVTVTECNAAVEALMAPDPNSADPEFDGRRVERVNGGFMILNAVKYRGIFSNATRREQTRLRVRRYRERQNSNPDVTECNASLLNVTIPSESTSASEKKEESEGKGRFIPPTELEVMGFAKESGKGENQVLPFINFYESNGWKVGKNPMKKWKNAFAGWVDRNGPGANGHPSPLNKRNEGMTNKVTVESGKLIAQAAKATVNQPRAK